MRYPLYFYFLYGQTQSGQYDLQSQIFQSSINSLISLGSLKPLTLCLFTLLNILLWILSEGLESFTQGFLLLRDIVLSIDLY